MAMQLGKLALAAGVMLALSGAAYAADAGNDPPKKEDVKKDPPKDAPAKDAPAKDPKDMTLEECEANGICPVTRKPSKPIYHVKLGDKEYHFATREASKEFQADPAKFGYKKDDAKK